VRSFVKLHIEELFEPGGAFFRGNQHWPIIVGSLWSVPNFECLLNPNAFNEYTIGDLHFKLLKISFPVRVCDIYFHNQVTARQRI